MMDPVEGMAMGMQLFVMLLIRNKTANKLDSCGCRLLLLFMTTGFASIIGLLLVGCTSKSSSLLWQ